MKKSLTILMFIFLIFLTLPLVYAENYGTGNYGSGLYSADDVATSPGGEASISGGSGGGGFSCSQDLDCGESQYCFNGQCLDAECSDDSSCNVADGETCWNQRCVKLFDIEILKFESPVQLGEFFDFTYLIKGVAEVNGDVEISFWIEQGGKIITSGLDTIYMGSYEEKIKVKELFLPSTVDSGTYEFYVQVGLGTYHASAHRTIEIFIGDDGIATITSKPDAKPFHIYIIAALIGLGVFVLLLVFYLERKKIMMGILREERFIKKHKVSILMLIFFVILGLLTYFLRGYEFIVDLIPPLMAFFSKFIVPYIYHILSTVLAISILILAVVIIKREKLFQRIWFFVKKHKTLLVVLAILLILSGIVYYLIYTGILKLDLLQKLWADFLDRIYTLVNFFSR